jgi:hypothetical protein
MAYAEVANSAVAARSALDACTRFQKPGGGRRGAAVSCFQRRACSEASSQLAIRRALQSARRGEGPGLSGLEVSLREKPPPERSERGDGTRRGQDSEPGFVGRDGIATAASGLIRAPGSTQRITPSRNAVATAAVRSDTSSLA